MGSGNSKEIVLTANPQGSSAFVQAQNDAAIEYERRQREAELAYRAAEDKIFQAGYKRGSEEAIHRIDDEVERHAKSIFSQSILELENKQNNLLQKETQRLQSSYYKPIVSSNECVTEEQKVLQCDDSIVPNSCKQAINEYQVCSEKILNKLMRPTLQ